MTARLEVLGGEGTVIRYGDVIVWAGPLASRGLLAFLTQSARNLESSAEGGRRIAEHLADLLGRRDPEPPVPFATLGPSADSWAALLHGPVQLWDGARWWTPSPVPGWLQIDVYPQPNLTVLGAGRPAPHLALSSPLDLRAGIVRGSGFALIGDEDIPAAGPVGAAGSVAAAGSVGATGLVGAAGPVPVPVATATSARPFDAPVDLRAPRTLSIQPLPPVGVYDPPTLQRTVVSGLRCGRGHFNHPRSDTCDRCGEDITDPTPVSGTRPPLGVLVTNDGAVYRVDRGYTIGPNPEIDPSVTGGQARPLPVPALPTEEEPEPGTQPRPYADIRIVDWQVVAVDRSSPSGIFVRAEGSSDWSRLDPHQARPLSPGMVLRFGPLSTDSADSPQLTLLSPWPLEG